MIRRIEALNYRCLRYVSQPLQPFHVLVGPNASGKSTFLDVVGLIRDFLTMGLDDAILAREDVFERRGRASRVDELIFNQMADRFELAIELEIPPDLDQSATNGRYNVARYEVAFGKDPGNGELTLISEALWLCSKPLQRPIPPLQLFPVEPTPPKKSLLIVQAQKGWLKVVSKTESGNDYFHSEIGKWNSSSRIGPRKAALTYLHQDEKRFPIALWVRHVLMEGIRMLALNSAAMRHPSSPSASRAFRVDGSNLPLVVRDFHNQHEDIFKEWVEHIRTVLPDVQTIDVVERPEDRQNYLAVRYSNLEQPVPSWLLSDGTLRLLALTLLAYLPHRQEIYLIEEAENGVHPRAIEAVFQSLSSVYDGQVLLATHSPLIVGLAKREQILCFARTPSGATSIVRGSEHPKLQDWHGQIDLGTLYAAGVLG
ncbi:ATP-binding protein [Candidatus Poribacteria bacterium]|nr:ATP-binding protein [Candidatus Poribacteria bacterium]